MARARRRALRTIFEIQPANKGDIMDIDRRLRKIELALGLPSPPRKRFEAPKEGDDDYVG